MQPASSGLVNKPSSYLLHAALFLGLFIDHEDGGNILLLNIS
jgi:hypothetical protein